MENSLLLVQWIKWSHNEAQKRGDKFTQKLLAEKAAIHQQYISKIIHGKRRLGDKVLTKICAALDITKAEFFTGPPSGVPEQPVCKIEKEFLLGDFDETDLRAEIARMSYYLDKQKLTEVFRLTCRYYEEQEAKKNIGNAS